MSDISFGPGFEAPSYADVLDRLNKSGRPELEKVSQILATAQMMHSTLSGFDSYKELADGISRATIDPLKQQLGTALDETSKALGKFVNAGNNALPGVTTDLLKVAKNPEDLLKAGKGIVSDLKAGGKGLLKTGKQKLDKFVNQAEQAGEDIKQGKMPKLSLDAGEGIGNDITDLFKSGLADIVPDLPGIETPIDMIGKTVQGTKQALSDSESILKTMPDKLNEALDRQLGKMPAKTLQNLREAGLSDADIKSNLLTPQKIQQYANIDYENPMRNMRMMQADDPDVFEENFNPKDFIKSYNTKFGRAPQVNEGKGLLKGDQDLSTKTYKDTLNKTPAEVEQITQDADKIPGDTVKLTKRALKTRSRTTKQAEPEPGEEAGPAPESQAGPAPEPRPTTTIPEQKIQAPKPSEIEPADSSLAEEGENAGNELAGRAFNPNTIITQQVNKVGQTLEDTGNSIADGIDKAKSLLSKATIDTSELDDSPIGDLINGVLGIATLGTMIAGLFDPVQKQTPIVSGEQIGV